MLLNRGLCLESMGKLSRSFTCDLDVLAWLEQYAMKEDKKQSYIVNSMLRGAMRQHQTWICSKCGGSNGNDSTVCYADIDCDGVKA